MYFSIFINLPFKMFVCEDAETLFQTFPFFGILPAILNDDGQEIEGIGEGSLVKAYFLSQLDHSNSVL